MSRSFGHTFLNGPCLLKLDRKLRQRCARLEFRYGVSGAAGGGRSFALYAPPRPLHEAIASGGGGRGRGRQRNRVQRPLPLIVRLQSMTCYGGRGHL
jgi:hypothetical protein